MDVQQSAEINELAGALALAQGELKNVAKDRQVSAGQRGSWTYADLATGLDMIRPVLSKHGLSVVQIMGFGMPAANEPGVVTITTQLMHKSGQWIRSHYPVAETGLPHQEMGSAVTYSRRYSLFPMVGIAGADDDDDGEKAGASPAGKRGRTVAPKTQAQPKAATASSIQQVDPAESDSLLHEILDRLDLVGTMEIYSALVTEINGSGITAKLTHGDYARLKAAFAQRRAQIEGMAQ